MFLIFEVFVEGGCFLLCGGLIPSTSSKAEGSLLVDLMGFLFNVRGRPRVLSRTIGSVVTTA